MNKTIVRAYRQIQNFADIKRRTDPNFTNEPEYQSTLYAIKSCTEKKFNNYVIKERVSELGDFILLLKIANKLQADEFGTAKTIKSLTKKEIYRILHRKFNPFYKHTQMYADDIIRESLFFMGENHDKYGKIKMKKVIADLGLKNLKFASNKKEIAKYLGVEISECRLSSVGAYCSTFEQNKTNIIAFKRSILRNKSLNNHKNFMVFTHELQHALHNQGFSFKRFLRHFMSFVFGKANLPYENMDVSRSFAKMMIMAKTPMLQGGNPMEVFLKTFKCKDEKEFFNILSKNVKNSLDDCRGSLLKYLALRCKLTDEIMAQYRGILGGNYAFRNDDKIIFMCYCGELFEHMRDILDKEIKALVVKKLLGRQDLPSMPEIKI